MKKEIRFVLILTATTLLLTACSGGTKPDSTSDKMYELGISAMETVDEFLDGTLGSDEALDRMAAAQEASLRLYEAEREETGSDTLFDTEYQNDYYIQAYIGFLESKMSRKIDGVGSSDAIIETRNALAGFLNEGRR